MAGGHATSIVAVVLSGVVVIVGAVDGRRIVSAGRNTAARIADRVVVVGSIVIIYVRSRAGHAVRVAHKIRARRQHRCSGGHRQSPCLLRELGAFTMYPKVPSRHASDGDS